MTALVKKRLAIESERLSSVEKHASLIVDEMTIKPVEYDMKYDKNLQKFVGAVDLGGVTSSESTALANKMIGFVLNGLNTRYKIPVAFFFVNSLIAPQPTDLTVHVIQKVEECGSCVDRLVTDCLSVNVKMFANLNGGTLHPVVPHPIQKEAGKPPLVFRPLFVSFDSCHGTKNVRNQYVYRTFVINGEEISGKYLRQLKTLQEGNLLCPVRKLTRKHTNPNNLERQKVKYAMDVLLPDVIATFKMLAENNEAGFENVQPTIKFLEVFGQLIAIHDVSSTSEHITKRLAVKKPFYSSDDERLLWLTTGFVDFLDNWRTDMLSRVRVEPNKEEKKKIKKPVLNERNIFCYEAYLDVDSSVRRIFAG